MSDAPKKVRDADGFGCCGPLSKWKEIEGGEGWVGGARGVGWKGGHYRQLDQWHRTVCPSKLGNLSMPGKNMFNYSSNFHSRCLIIPALVLNSHFTGPWGSSNDVWDQFVPTLVLNPHFTRPWGSSNDVLDQVVPTLVLNHILQAVQIIILF